MKRGVTYCSHIPILGKDREISAMAPASNKKCSDYLGWKWMEKQTGCVLAHGRIDGRYWIHIEPLAKAPYSVL